MVLGAFDDVWPFLVLLKYLLGIINADKRLLLVNARFGSSKNKSLLQNL